MKTTFEGEFQFKGFSDSSRNGPCVTFRLADRADLEQFIGMEGVRFMVAGQRINDDETPAEEPAVPAPQASPAPGPATARVRMAPLCEWAVLRCAEEPFQHWIVAAHEKSTGGVTAAFSGKVEDYAAHCVKVLCGVASRKDLDTDAEAAAKFHDVIRKPYTAWLNRGVPA